MTYTALVEALKAKLVFDGLFVVRDAEEVLAQIKGSRWSVAQVRKTAISKAAGEWLASR